MNPKSLLLGAALVATLASAGAAGAQPAPYPDHGQSESNRNIDRVADKLSQLIAQLNLDRHDYDGHRLRAIQLLEQGQDQLQAAIRYERAHDRY